MNHSLSLSVSIIQYIDRWDKYFCDFGSTTSDVKPKSKIVVDIFLFLSLSSFLSFLKSLFSKIFAIKLIRPDPVDRDRVWVMMNNMLGYELVWRVETLSSMVPQSCHLSDHLALCSEHFTELLKSAWNLVMTINQGMTWTVLRDVMKGFILQFRHKVDM